MSRRKQSNPKPLKSDMENSSVETAVADSKESMSADESSMDVKSAGDDWDSDPGEETSSTADQSVRRKSVTSLEEDCQQVAEGSAIESCASETLNLQTQQSPDEISRNSRERSPQMANSGKDSSRSSSPVSFAECQKVSNSYLAAALKLSTAAASSRSDLNCSSKQERSYSPPESPSSGGRSSKGPRSNFPSHPFLNVSLGEAVAISAASITSSLLKNSAGDSNHHLSSMIQGFPLLSSVLPALQHLNPTSLASLSSGGGGGIVCVCGVKFNSTSNLEAHRMFYCSQRPVLLEGRNEQPKEENQSPSSRDREEEQHSPTGRLLKCPHCNYTTTHKLSLNGHMNIHTSPEETTHASNSSSSTFSIQPTDPKAQERYCSDCDIQFSSMKTYRVHKLHYCQTRHVLKGAKSPARDEPIHHMSIPGLGSIGDASNSGQLILALPTNPILLLPYSLVAGAQILPPHILPQIGAAFVLPNGQVHPISSAASTQQQQHSVNGGGSVLPPLLSPSALAAATAAVLTQSSPSGSHSSNASQTTKNEPTHRGSRSPKEEYSRAGKRRGERDTPLDLTTKRPKLAVKTDLLNDEEKENREINRSDMSKSPTLRGSFSEGEFEGKLLSSPLRASPPSGEDHGSGRVSRPTSTAPSLSPRVPPPESPKPSTSALSTSSRSPGRSSPVNSSGGTQGLPPLPPGFPSHLVSSLESLSNSLPLASLQCLQSLQNVPRELALKLLSPDLLMKGLPPVLNPPVIVKQGEAKCNECNIVFYKEESLQIHKKHYCSARDTKKLLEDERRNGNDQSPTDAPIERATSPLRSPVRDLPTASTAQSTIPKDSSNSKQSKTLLQFICTACGIKFSSPDNLAAHQTYYCPKREGAGEEGVAKGVWRCPRCRVVMAETMQAAHRCVSPSPAPSHGWKCPCCPVLSPTAAAAQKHLETHSGIKAFRCTICGYRGNTLRGMRTHIRMHFEKRTNDLQEENFIACILDDDEPKSGRTSVVSSDTRKLLDSTRILLENSALNSLFNREEKLPDQAAADPSSPYTCIYCPFASPLQTTLLQHLTLAHSVGLESKITQEIKNFLRAKAAVDEANEKQIMENGSRDSLSPVPPVKLEPEVKLEVTDSDDEFPRQHEDGGDPKSPIVSIATATLSNGSPPLTSGQCYCHTCNISFSLVDSYVAHKKFYCTRPESRTPPETTVQ